jgi:aminopeptidase N
MIMESENISKVEAMERSSIISNVKYQVFLDFSALNTDKSAKSFRSRTTVNFSCAEANSKSTWIDVRAQTIEAVTLNGQKVDASNFDGSRLVLNANMLTRENVLEVDATFAYSNNGEGLHKYYAEDEDEVYLYSQFEVPDSRKMFAVFEQPDIKATFDFTVVAPANWVVTSVTREVEKQIDERGCNVIKFGTSPIMSSYLTSICAGPFKVWDAEHQVSDRVVPMRILARKSLAEFVDYDTIFDITKRGFDYYASLFGVSYPFEKYDQVFMPQFNAGAMENIGNVVYREDYIFSVKVTDALKERRIITILHELAHMWFGDLVTMKWWEDLWLNESFAEFVSTLATDEAIGKHDIWIQYNVREKAWGLEQDEYTTTHPISAHIRDLDDILVNFDGITYAKGAATVQALVEFCGRELFFKGIHNYLEEFKYSNASISDLVRHLSNVTGKDVESWAKMHIQTAGANYFSIDFSEENGVFTKFNIVQRASETNPTLRQHNFKIGFYNFVEEAESNLSLNVTATGALNLRGAKLVRTQQFNVATHAESTTAVEEILGQRRPDLIILNDEGMGYGKFELDDNSLEVALHFLHKISDPLARSLVYNSLWFALRDAKVAPTKLVNIIVKAISSETSSITMQTMLRNLRQCIFTYIKPEERLQLIKSVGSHLWDLTKSATPASDAQYQLLNAFCDYASTGDHISVLNSLIHGELQLRGLKLDNKLLWRMRSALARLSVLDKAQISLARSNDKSEFGRIGAANALASLGNSKSKQATIDAVFSKFSELSNSEVEACAAGFSDVFDLYLLEDWLYEYFNRIVDVWEQNDFHIAETILRGFYPGRMASLELVQLCERWLDANADKPDALKRIIIENCEDTRRAVKAQKLT